MNLARAVERATVGALLLEPAGLQEVRDWLEPRDFDGIAESQAFSALVELGSRAEAVTPEGVEGEVRLTVAPGTQQADAAHLVTLMQETPEAARVTTYARMVLELSIRRQVATEAIGLRQHAESATSTTDLNMVFAHVDGIRRGIESLHRRETTAAQSHGVSPTIPDGALPQLVRFPRSEHGVVEREAIIALVDQPAALERVTRWLRAGDFGDEEAASLFSELVALHDAHNPIDRITLAWRAARVGIDGPICDSLVQGPGSAVTGEPDLAARRVLEQSVQQAVVATSEELERMADDPAVNATSVAYARLNALWPQQRRLVKARFGLAE